MRENDARGTPEFKNPTRKSGVWGTPLSGEEGAAHAEFLSTTLPLISLLNVNRNSYRACPFHSHPSLGRLTLVTSIR